MKLIKQLIMVLCIVAPLIIHSQESTQKTKEYYFKVLDTANSRKTKSKILNKLLKVLEKKETEASYYEKAVYKSIESENYDLAYRFVFRGYAYVNQVLSEKEKIIKLHDSLYKYQDKLKKRSLIGSINRRRGYYHINSKEYDNAIKHFSIAIKHFNKSKSKITSYLYRGHSYKAVGDYVNALKDYSAVDSISNDLNKYDKNYYGALGAKANIYGEIGLYDEALKVYNLIIKEREKHNRLNDIGYDFFNLGVTYKKMKNTRKCIENILIAIKYSREQAQTNNSPLNPLKKTALRNLVINYSFLMQLTLDKNLQEAKKYLDSTALYYNKLKKDPLISSEYNKAKAIFLFKSGEFSKAEAILNKELKVSQSKKNISSILNYEGILHIIYSKKKDYSNAYKHLNSFLKLKDSIASLKKSNNLIYYQTLYDTEQKEKEIITQQKDIEILDTKNKAKQQYLIFGGAGLILIFGTILLYRNRKQLQKEKKVQEIYSKNLLITQENERERISKDLHDGLGQSLLIIKNKVALQKDPETKDLIKNAIEEMRTISRILYPSQLEDSGITLALKNLITQLDENYKDTYIFGDIENFDKKLPIDKEVNVFRIVQECLSNVIKHAKAKSAKVIITNRYNEVSIEIKDNGIGFDFSEKYNDFKSLGLKTIKKRVAFLNGSLNIDSTKKIGTTFLIEIPIT